MVKGTLRLKKDLMNNDAFIDYKTEPTIEKRNAIVENHLYMVDIFVKKYLGKGVEYDDLYQVGALALLAAVERFDPEKGDFKAFASKTILGEIKKYFRDKQWSLKVPRRLKEVYAKVKEVREELFAKNKKMPTVSDISQVTGFSEDQIIEALDAGKVYSTHSLDVTFNEMGEEGESQYLEKFLAVNDVGYERIEQEEIINKVVSGFTDQFKYIFRERFLYSRSQSEIAKSLGVSQMTISRAEKKIIDSFRQEIMEV